MQLLECKAVWDFLNTTTEKATFEEVQGLPVSAMGAVEPKAQIRAERDSLLEWAEWVQGLAVHKCSGPGCKILRDIQAYAQLVLDDIRLRRSE
jgi:hypothetical protein